MENTLSQTAPVPNSGFLKGFLKWLPLAQWILLIMIAVSVFALSTADPQSASALGARAGAADDKQKDESGFQFEQLRREQITRENFDAYHKSVDARLGRMEKLLEQMLRDQTGALKRARSNLLPPENF